MIDDETPQPSPFYERIYALTHQVPAGSVATYGQIAMVGNIPSPRIAGYAMAAVPSGSDVPWQRIINSQGKISSRSDSGGPDHRQRRLLIAEGVIFNASGRVDFKQVGWEGPSWEWLETNGYDIGDLIEKSADLRRTGAWSRWKF